MSGFLVRVVSWREAAAELSAVRRAVFIEEQHVPEDLEWDGEDEAAIHVLACDDRRTPIGTGRLLLHDGLGHIGRMAVVKPWRQKSVGSEILLALLDAARTHDCVSLLLNAQTYAVPFYERFGFAREDGEFMDAGIPHQRMGRTC